MNKITKISTLSCIVGAFLCAANTKALSFADAGVVGAAKGYAGDNQKDEAVLAQNILDLVGLGTSTTADLNQTSAKIDDSFAGGVDDREYWNSTVKEYSGTLTGGAQGTDFGPGLSVAGYAYVLGKYNGQNAGYVLFNVADYIAAAGTDILPQYSSPSWGSGNQYALSHITGFGATSVPDGGATAALLGLGFLGLAAISRKRS